MIESESRRAIKALAEELLIRNGYRGMGYAEVAARLGITRANIHYHFGSKAKLIDEVLADYVEATLATLRQVWTAETLPLDKKLKRMLAFSRQRYDRFNDGTGPVRPWSLISRLRQDQELLTPAGRELLSRFSTELRDIFAVALSRAVKAREVTTDIASATTLLVAIADSAAPITIAEGGFKGLEAAYDALATLILK